MQFSGTTVVVTGGSSGIGSATVARFVAENLKVYSLDIKRPNWRLWPGTCHIDCDVSNPSDIRRSIESVLQKETSIDYLIASAGTIALGTIEETSLEDFDRVVSTNFRGVFLTLKAILPYMCDRPGGSIVLLGSDQSLIGKPRNAIYGATKGAIAQLAKSTALDYAAKNIRVNCVCPGVIDTAMLQQGLDDLASHHSASSRDKFMRLLTSRQPLRRLGRADEVAALIAFLCSDEASFITGALISIDGGYVAQ